MKRKSYIIVSAAGLGLLAAGVLMFFIDTTERDLPEPTTVYIRYAFLLKNDSREPLLNSTFSLFGPVPTTPSQEFRAFTASVPMEIEKDEAGNLSFVASGLDVPPFGSKSLAITVAMDLQTEAKAGRLENRDDYLKQEDYLDMASPAVIAAARQFEGMDTKDIPLAIYQWLIQNVEAVGYIAQARGADYALQQGKGDCTEFMHAFIALARLNGIPARAVGGFVLETEAALVRSHEYHNWAEFHQDGRWIVADAQKQVFDQLGTKKYIAFRYLGGDPESQNFSQRFLTFDSRLSVQMM